MSFEKHTRRKIKNYSSEVDTDALWNSIKNDIPQERDRKKRGIFFWFLGIAIAGSVIIFSYKNQLLPERNHASSVIAIQSENTYHNFPKETIYTPNKSISTPSTEIISIQSNSSVNKFVEKEQTNQNEYLGILDARVINIFYKNPKPTISHLESKEETLEEVVPITIKEEDDDNLATVENIPQPKRILVAERRMDEELLPINLEEEEEEEEEKEEEEKEESRKKKSGSKPGYAITARADMAATLKETPVYSKSTIGISNARKASHLVTQHLKLSKTYQNGWLFSVGLHFLSETENISFRSADVIQSTNSNSASGSNNNNTPSRFEIQAFAASEDEESYIDRQNDAEGSTYNIVRSKPVNLEIINTNKYIGTSLEIAYQHQLKNEKVFLIIGGGAHLNYKFNSTGYQRVSGFENLSSERFILKQNANKDKKELRIRPVLSSSFNLELNSFSHLIIGFQYEANPHVVGFHTGVRFMF